MAKTVKSRDLAGLVKKLKASPPPPIVRPMWYDKHLTPEDRAAVFKLRDQFQAGEFGNWGAATIYRHFKELFEGVVDERTFVKFIRGK